MGTLSHNMSLHNLLFIFLCFLYLQDVSANCRTCICNIKSEDAVLRGGRESYFSSSREICSRNIFEHISCRDVGERCPGNCLPWARGLVNVNNMGHVNNIEHWGAICKKIGREETQGVSLYSHSQVECGSEAQGHSSLGVRVCCVNISNRGLAKTFASQDPSD